MFSKLRSFAPRFSDDCCLLQSAEPRMKRTYFGLVGVFMGFAAFLSGPSQALAQIAPPLGVVQQFSVLGSSGVTGSSGAGTVVNGDVGSSPTATITNFPPSSVTPPFTLHSTNDATVQQARTDAIAADNFLSSQGPGTVLPAQLSGAVLGSGIYSFAAGADLAASGTLTLNGPGTFIFQVASALTTNAGSNVTGTANPCNVFWRVGTSASLKGSNFRGNVFAESITVDSISLGLPGSNVTGRVIAARGSTGAVTMGGAGGNTIGGCASICPLITVNPATLPNGIVGSPYNATISATGGAAPFAFSVTGGALPGGLSLGPTTGAITGTPTLAGTFNFTITATDSNGCAGSRAYTVMIATPPCPVITVSPATLPNGVIGSAYSQTMSGTGGTAPYTFTVTNGALPNGFSLNSTTGAIAGTPASAGTFNFTITAMDANGCPGSRAYSVAVTAQLTLGAAQSFAILGSSTVTNTGASSIRGDVGVSPGTSVTGFPPGVVTGGTIHAGDALAAQAQTDLTSAYNAAAGRPCNVSLAFQDLGGRTLTPGVYCDLGPTLTGTLTLDFQGNPNALFVFQTPSLFTTAANSSVLMTNAAGSTCPPNVFWQVGSSSTLGSNSGFVGNLVVFNSITLNTGARLNGRALARNGAVTMDNNNVGVCNVFPRGDANGDGTISVGDVFYLINFLFAGGPAPIGPADANGDGQVTVGDIFYLINHLFAGGPPPV